MRLKPATVLYLAPFHDKMQSIENVSCVICSDSRSEAVQHWDDRIWTMRTEDVYHNKDTVDSDDGISELVVLRYHPLPSVKRSPRRPNTTTNL